MKKIRSLILSLLLLSTTAHATTHYFDNGSPDNTLPCTSGDPCDNFAGTTLDNAGALSAGDVLLFKRGDEWVAGEANLTLNTSGTAANYISVGAWGTGARPIFAGAAVTTAGWTSLGSGRYSISGQTQTNLNTVTFLDSYGLMRWTGSTATLPARAFIRSGTTLYVHGKDDENPATSSVRIGSYDTSFNFGLVRDTETSTRANYHRYSDLHIIAANGRGFSLHGTGSQTSNLLIVGAGYDGYLGWYRSTNGQAQQFESYYDEVVGGAAMGSGFGQGVTVYGSPFTFFVGLYSHDNGMAGLDFLDFASDTNVTESGAIRCRLINNSLIPFDPSYDANLYVDGASELFFWGNEIAKGGGYLNNLRSSVTFGSEKPTTKKPENIQFINSLVYGTHGSAVQTNLLCFGSTSECPPDGNTKPSTVKNITNYFNTIMALDSGGSTYDFVYNWGNADATADNIKFYGNIMVSDSTVMDGYANTGSNYDADRNLYYDRGSASSSTTIFNTCIDCAGTSYNLASWRTATGEDANSAYGDPLFVTDGDTNPDVHLGNSSPAIDLGPTTPYTYFAWLPQEIKDDIGPYGIRGTTRASGAFDNVSSAPDAGYHYSYARLMNVTVTPTSATAGTVTTYTVSFDLKKYVTVLPSNWKIKFTFPSGYVISSGATSVFASSTIDGTFSTLISGQDITVTRVGDGTTSFPGTYTFTITNIKNPTSAGTTGSFYLETQNSSGTKIAEYFSDSTNSNAIPGITISSSGGSVCGNSVIEAGESCDDGNTTALDGCSATCQTETPVCGNSIVEYLEQCDDGNTTALDGCSATCQIENPVCGNSAVESGEQCDDGNTTAGDGCSATCQNETASSSITITGDFTFSGDVTIS